MYTSNKKVFRFIQIALLSVILSIFILGGCARPRRTIAHAPTILQIANPESLSDEELQEISTCEYWKVCIFHQQEKIEPFGPNFLFEGRFKYVPRESCRFETCDRLEAFHHTPRK